MSAALESIDGGGALGRDEGRARSARAENEGWEIDRATQVARSERRAWLVSGICLFVTILAIGAVFVQGPLRRVVTVPLVVDKVTGETTIATTLDVDTIPAVDALDMHNAVKFVRCREGYNWWFLQRDYDCVRRMATPGVFTAYNQQFDGPESLDKRLGSQGEHRVRMIGIRLPPNGRSGNTGEAIVTFEKEMRLPNKPHPELQRFVATIRFEYRPKVLEKQEDRIENPFGFLATAYRADAELDRKSVV